MSQSPIRGPGMMSNSRLAYEVAVPSSHIPLRSPPSRDDTIESRLEFLSVEKTDQQITLDHGAALILEMDTAVMARANPSNNLLDYLINRKVRRGENMHPPSRVILGTSLGDP